VRGLRCGSIRTLGKETMAMSFKISHRDDFHPEKEPNPLGRVQRREFLS
jgi:hypothetical protein